MTGTLFFASFMLLLLWKDCPARLMELFFCYLLLWNEHKSFARLDTFFFLSRL
jgi:hypothetical protein